MELPFVGDARESGGAFHAYATAAIDHDSGGVLPTGAQKLRPSAAQQKTQTQITPNLKTLMLKAPILKTVVREGLVGFCHTMHVFALLDGRTFAFSGIQHFACKTLNHRFLTATTRRVNQPAHCKRLAA